MNIKNILSIHHLKKCNNIPRKGRIRISASADRSLTSCDQWVYTKWITDV